MDDVLQTLKVRKAQLIALRDRASSEVQKIDEAVKHLATVKISVAALNGLANGAADSAAAKSTSSHKKTTVKATPAKSKPTRSAQVNYDRVLPKFLQLLAENGGTCIPAVVRTRFKLSAEQARTLAQRGRTAKFVRISGNRRSSKYHLTPQGKAAMKDSKKTKSK